MFKKIVIFFVLLFAMESPSYGAHPNPAQARLSLQQANIIFMNLMLGSQGIRTIQSTPEECRQMIDGCLTVGITDRLYGFDSQSDVLRAMADQLQDIRKAHALLAIEFYEVGYLNMQDNSNRHIPAKFNALCNLVFPSGTIFEYKKRLEDEIKRASQPLRYAHFGIGVAPAVGAEEPSLINPEDLMGSAASVASPPPSRPMAGGLLGDIAGGAKLRKTGTPSPSVDAILLPGAAVAPTPRPGFLSSITGGAGGLKKAATPPPPAAVSVVSPPAGHLSAIQGGLASLKKVDSLSPVVAAAASQLPADQAVASPPPASPPPASPPPAAAVDAPPQANLGGFSGSTVDSMLATVKKKPESDEDSDAEPDDWDD